MEFQRARILLRRGEPSEVTKLIGELNVVAGKLEEAASKTQYRIPRKEGIALYRACGRVLTLKRACAEAARA